MYYIKLKEEVYFISSHNGAGIHYRGSFPSVTHFDNTPPMFAGESAMLRFNDEWVKGGGFWLAGPKKK